jgi:hypothetical protein
MRYVLYRSKSASSTSNDALTIGAMVNDTTVADVTAALNDNGVPNVHSMRIFLEMGEKSAAIAKAAVADTKYHRATGDIDLRAPIYDP